MYKKMFLFLILGVLLVGTALASLDCGTNPSFSIGYNKSQIPSGGISTIQCSGNADEIYLAGEGMAYISISSADTSISGTKYIQLNINQNIPVDSYLFSMIFKDNNTQILSIPMNIIIYGEQQSPQQNPGIIVFPTVKVVNVQQGSEKYQSIQIIVTENYPRTITIQEVSFNPDSDLVRFGDLNLGPLSPGGQPLNIPLIIDGKNAQINGPGDNIKINILATDSEGQIQLPSVDLKIIVTAGVTAGNGTLSKPDCALSSTELQLNSTATFTCSNVVSSIDIFPLYNANIEGINAELTQNGIYTYTFKPIQISNSYFIAQFLKGTSSIFSPFTKEIRITKSGTALAGTALEISFYQETIKKALSELLPGEVSILIRDSLTQNIVSSFTAYLNGKIINNSFILEANKPYEMIIDSPSYLSKTINFTINPQYITISLNPSSGWVEGSFVYYNVTENASVFLDGIKLTSNNFVPSAGNHTLEAILDGYINTKLNITVLETVRIITSILEWKKGVQQSMMLSKSASWQINYAKDLASQYNPISSGVGTNISFTPEKSGLYQVIADGKVVDSKEIKGRDWGKKWWFMAWYWWILLGIGIVIVIILLYRRNGGGVGSNISEGGFRMQGVGGGE